MKIKMRKNEAAKIAILREILKEKTILFAAFSDKVSKELKQTTWKHMANTAKSLNMIESDKPYTYIRDTFWPNIRNSTMKKIDNAKNTGTGGGIQAKLSYIDNLVLDIIGKESPGVVGLGKEDSLMEEINSSLLLLEYNSIVDDVQSINNATEAETLPLEMPSTSKGQSCYKNSKRNNAEEEKCLNKRKLELKIEQLELQNYKLKLEIYEKERNLDLSHSNYVNDILPK